MLRTRNLTLSGTAQEVTIDDDIDNPNDVSIQNTSQTGYAYLGNESVTTTNYGHRLFPGQTFTIELNKEDKIFAAGDTGVTIAAFIIERP